jgi:hypothetical protein
MRLSLVYKELIPLVFGGLEPAPLGDSAQSKHRYIDIYLYPYISISLYPYISISTYSNIAMFP